MKKYKSYREVQERFDLPSWFNESNHKIIIAILSLPDAGLLQAVKYLKETGYASATRNYQPDHDLGLKLSKEVCDFINSIKPLTIEDALEEIDVLPPGTWENDLQNVFEWYAVANNKGIIAYFGNEDDANRFRMAEANRILNG